MVFMDLVRKLQMRKELGREKQRRPLEVEMRWAAQDSGRVRANVRQLSRKAS